MRITLKELRHIIADEVQRNNRWSAGMFMAGGISNSGETAPTTKPALGSPEQQEEDEEKEDERLTQPGARHEF